MNPPKTFIPFNIKCYQKLLEKFENQFEAELINEICESGTLKSFGQDDLLMEIGMVINEMPLVISGSVKIMTEDKDGEELLLYYLELGDTCAITLNCCTQQQKSSVKAITEEPCEILFIPISKMDDWMVKYKSWRAFVLGSYNLRLNEMLESIDNLVFHSMEERVLKYLSDKSAMSKSSSIRITHSQIANDLHSSRVVVSRIMKKLEREKLVKQSRNLVILLAV